MVSLNDYDYDYIMAPLNKQIVLDGLAGIHEYDMSFTLGRQYIASHACCMVRSNGIAPWLPHGTI